MIEAFNPFETQITFYVLLNALLCICTAFGIGGIFFTRRYLFVKPSMLLLTFSHIFFQWPMTIYAGYYEKFLPDPYVFALLIHAYILVGLLITVFTFRVKARGVWMRITAANFFENAVVGRGALAVLLSLVLCVMGTYFFYVPFTSTGLYAIFADPANAAVARERSLKLLNSQALKYGYSLMVSSIAPLLTVILSIRIVGEIRKKSYAAALIHLIFFCLIAFSVSVTGARVAMVNLFIVMAMALLFHKGLPFKPFKGALFLFLLLSLPTMLSILREGKAIAWGNMIEYLGYLARRTFILTMDVGAWYVHYSQIHGSFGVASIPKLAVALGVEPLNTPNLIGLAYMNTAVTSVSAVAGYLFSYYSYFGIASLLFSVLCLWFLDVALLVYQRLSNGMLLPCMAAASVSILSFISSDYTTVWLTHGFGVILLLSWVIDHFLVASPQVSKPAS